MAAGGEALGAGGYRRAVARAEFAQSAVAVSAEPHAWSLDLAASHGGPGAQPDPVTAFLGSLCGCLLMSLRVLGKSGLRGASCSAEANAKGYVRQIAVELVLDGDASDDALAADVARAEKGCFVRELIGSHVDVATTWRRA
ncbi:MAG: OsmC family protein [Acidimicrobiales bacterium]